ncbi:MAG TPA: L,D-transpeptidase, partial [Beijerinckiaceae bacterium]
MRIQNLALAAVAAGVMTLGAGAAQAQESAADFFSSIFQPSAGFSSRPQQSAIPRQVVQFTMSYSPGTIVVSTKERRLYYVMGGGKAIQYGVGVGRPGFQWGGVKAVTRKAEWPAWTPPPQMLKRRPDLP